MKEKEGKSKGRNNVIKKKVLSLLELKWKYWASTILCQPLILRTGSRGYWTSECGKNTSPLSTKYYHTLPFSRISDRPSTPSFLSSNRQERLTHLFQQSEAALMSSWQTEQSSPVNTAGMASDHGRITLSWQRCEVMSACDEIIMQAHLPACDVSTVLAWLSTVQLLSLYWWKWGETWK